MIEPPDCTPIEGRTTTRYVHEGLGGRSMFVRSAGAPGKRRPVLLLHDLPGSSALLDGLVRTLGAGRHVIAPDLTGMGQSPETVGASYWNDSALIGWLDVADLLNRVGGGAECDLVAVGGSAMIALEMMSESMAPSFDRGEQRRVKAASLTLIAPPVLTEPERGGWQAHPMPSAVPEMDGTHLLRVWHQLRDMELWRPWFDRRREKARTSEPRISAAALTLRAREMLKHPASYAAAWTRVIAEPIDARLAALPRLPTLLMAAKADLFAHCLPRAAALMPHAKAIEIEDSDAARAAAIEAFLKAQES